MSLVSKTNTEKNYYELTIAISAEELEAACQKVYLRQRNNIQINGFRKGKAPRQIIEKKYGEGVFWEDAINDLYPEAVQAAVEEAELDVVAIKPGEAESISKAEGAVFKVTAVVRPEVTLKEYKGLKASKVVKEVTDEEVLAEVERRRQANARTITIEDRAAEMGDEVIIDFDGSVDGVQFPGGQANGMNLTLGSGQFIPGFEEKVVGHNIGEEFDIDVTFPEDYHAEDLAGKAAVFKINLHEIHAKELPELDDEFAKDVSEFDTLDELKADIRKKLEEASEQAADTEFESALMKALVEENMEADIPVEMYEAKVEEMMQDQAARMQSYGISMDMYLQMTGMTTDSMMEQMRPTAESQVKMDLALAKVVALENIEVSDEDLEAEYEKMAVSVGYDVETVKNMTANVVDDIKHSIAMSKAVEVIKASAIVE